MNVFLIIVSIVMAVILFIVSFYVLAIYCHPDDKGIGTHLFLKLLVILGLTLSWAQVLMVPLDVANSSGVGGDLDMQTFWTFIYCIIAIMIIFLLPFSIFLYETDEDKNIISRIITALILLMISLAFTSLILFLSWNFFQYAEIPVQAYSQNAKYFQSSNLPLSTTYDKNITSKQEVLQIQVTFIIYLMGIMSFFGWFLFSIFAAIGIVALPMELIQQFKYKPKQISSKQGAAQKLGLKAELSKLIEIGLKVKSDKKDLEIASGGYWKTRKLKNEVQTNSDKFIADVLSFESDFQLFQEQLDYQNLNPLVFWGKLFLGIIFSIISFIIWLHIIIYEATKVNYIIPTHPFLNTMLIDLQNSGAGFIASSIFAGILIYLLICTVKGNFKCGLRIPFLFTLHPMKQNETFMNSFIFNVMLILISSVSLTQFSTSIFSDYCRFTTISMFYGNQVTNLKFFKYFFQYNVFGYTFVGVTIITLIYLFIFPNDKPKELRQYQQTLKEKKNKK